MRPGADGKSERWFNTGDLGLVDANGYFRLSGRQKELIIRGGHNIDPGLIEGCLQQHPSVALVAAIGRPDEHSGEVPVAYVQLKPDQRTAPDELMRFAKSAIPERAAWPKHIRIVQTLPTTAVGKIFKPALMRREVEALVRDEAEACGGTLSHCEAVQDPRLGLVLKWSARKRAKELSSCQIFRRLIGSFGAERRLGSFLPSTLCWSLRLSLICFSVAARLEKYALHHEQMQSDNSSN